jgi:hypothetical protein
MVIVAHGKLRRQTVNKRSELTKRGRKEVKGRLSLRPKNWWCKSRDFGCRFVDENLPADPAKTQTLAQIGERTKLVPFDSRVEKRRSQNMSSSSSGLNASK